MELRRANEILKVGRHRRCPQQSAPEHVTAPPGPTPTAGGRATNTRPTQVLAPVPAGVSCASLVRGCRALTISYATATTATGTSPAQWGDYLGRVTQVAFTAWDPDATPPAMRTVVMARYSYDSGGRLRAQWDPRLDWADTSTTPPTTRHLAETYDYDADGIITTLTPARCLRGGGRKYQPPLRARVPVSTHLKPHPRPVLRNRPPRRPRWRPRLLAAADWRRRRHPGGSP
jgi:hypothetical protein